MMLTLIVPGILEVLFANPDIRAPRLEKWVARALPAKTQSRCYEQSLLDALGYEPPAFAELPAADCTWLTDFDESAPVNCCRADPIHLQTDKDHARLIPVESLALELAEAREMVNVLNGHFADDGIRFSVGQKGRWYISGVKAPLPDTQPTSQVAGRNVASFLPNSPETARWRQVAIESQMLLHSLPVNQLREKRGLPAVNSLWFWGGGKLSSNESVHECKVFSNAAYAIGAGKLAGIRVYPLEESVAGLSRTLIRRDKRQSIQIRHPSAVLVLDTRVLEGILSGNVAAQLDVLAQLDNGIFAVADKLLMRGLLSRVRIDTCDGRCFDLSRRALLSFWKKARPLVQA